VVNDSTIHLWLNGKHRLGEMNPEDKCEKL